MKPVQREAEANDGEIESWWQCLCPWIKPCLKLVYPLDFSIMWINKYPSLLKFKKSIVDSQCHVNFYCTAKWFSNICAYYIHTHTHTHTNIPFHILFHYGVSKDTEYSSLCYTVGCCYFSILYIDIIIWPMLAFFRECCLYGWQKHRPSWGYTFFYSSHPTRWLFSLVWLQGPGAPRVTALSLLHCLWTDLGLYLWILCFLNLF